MLNHVGVFFSVVLPGIWKGALWAVLLNVHPKETNIDPVYFLKCKKCFGSVRESLHHLAWVHKPKGTEAKVNLEFFFFFFFRTICIFYRGIISMLRSFMFVCLFSDIYSYVQQEKVTTIKSLFTQWSDIVWMCPGGEFQFSETLHVIPFVSSHFLSPLRYVKFRLKCQTSPTELEFKKKISHTIKT